jgi:hypothetical protein
MSTRAYTHFISFFNLITPNINSIFYTQDYPAICHFLLASDFLLSIVLRFDAPSMRLPAVRLQAKFHSLIKQQVRLQFSKLLDAACLYGIRQINKQVKLNKTSLKPSVSNSGETPTECHKC